MKYKELKEKHQEDINSFLHEHAFFAFSKDQFNEGVDRFRKAGKLDDRPLKEQLFKFGSGGYMLNSKMNDWDKLGDTITDEEHAAMQADPDGTGYNLELWRYELPNYEFSYSWDLDDVFLNLGVPIVNFWRFPGLYKGLVKAVGKLEPSFPIGQYDFLDIDKINNGSAAPVLPDRPLIKPGQLVQTVATAEQLPKGEMMILVHRHLSGDYGTICQADREANKEAIVTGARIISQYDTAAGPVMIITEADRSTTTVLFTSEY